MIMASHPIFVMGWLFCLESGCTYVVSAACVFDRLHQPGRVAVYHVGEVQPHCASLGRIALSCRLLIARMRMISTAFPPTVFTS